MKQYIASTVIAVSLCVGATFATHHIIVTAMPHSICSEVAK